MTNHSVVSEEYVKLQQSFIDKQEEWLNKYSDFKVTYKKDAPDYHKTLLSQVIFRVKRDELLACIGEMLALLSEQAPTCKKDVERLQSLIDEKIAGKWRTEIISSNSAYFEKFAAENQIAEWIPQFIAEQAVAPLLKKIAISQKSELAKFKVKDSCPCCGEAPRLATLKKDGKKNIVCPRCHYAWTIKKLVCAYCDREEHKQALIIQTKEKSSEQVQICKSCYQYTKVIDTKRLLKQVNPSLLDIQTIYLDYIAQDQIEKMEANQH